MSTSASASSLAKKVATTTSVHKPTRLRFRIRRGILMALVLLVIVCSVTIWLVGDIAGRATADAMMAKLSARVRDSVRTEVAAELSRAMQLCRLNARLIENATFDLNRKDSRYLLTHLVAMAEEYSLDAVFVAAKNGLILWVQRQPNGTLKRHAALPASGAEPARRFWEWTDPASGETTSAEENGLGIDDPRRESWYALATQRGQTWSHVTALKPDGQAGLTAVAVVKKAHLADYTNESEVEPEVAPPGEILGVVGVNVRLATLCKMMERAEVGATDDAPTEGRAFLLDEHGHVIAHKDSKFVFAQPVTQTGAEIALADAATSSDAAVATTLAAYAEQVATAAGRKWDRTAPLNGATLPWPPREAMRVKKRVENTGTGWQLMLEPLADKDAKEALVLPPLTIGVALPDRDFLVELRRNELISGLIALGMALLGVGVAYLLARGIAMPITQIESEMGKVQNLDLNVRGSISSHYVEIDQIAERFAGMVKGLKSFSRYVPRDVVRDLIATGMPAEVGGEERDLTISFADIRDFTSIAESMPPQPLFDQLRDYFEIVTAQIRQHEGTVDKFIGDCVMALWNAPRLDEHHRLHGVLAAIDVQRVLTDANAKWQREGKPPFYTRIGLSTARVIVGNVGSSERLSYTALGDGVNLASRLEGANRLYGTSIIASEALIHGLPPGKIAVQPLDVLAVKGKAQGVRIYEVLGRADDVPPARLRLAERFAVAFEAYLARRFYEAMVGFEAVMANLRGYRPAELMAARCKNYIDHPPGPEWNGVFTLHEK